MLLAIFTTILISASPSLGQPRTAPDCREYLERSGDQPVDLQNGRRQFSACLRCHTLAPRGNHKTGPNLYGIVGAPIGRFEDYNYSTALKSHKGIWTISNLNKWLERPAAFIPRTRMVFSGIRSERDRRDVIGYLICHDHPDIISELVRAAEKK